MDKASAMFTDADRARIADAVAKAEATTSAEIVPIVASASGRYDRAEDMVGLWLGLIALVVVWALYPLPENQVGSWGGAPAVAQLLCMIVALIIGFFVGALFCDRISWLRRLFTPRRQMKDEVESAARTAFYDARVRHTKAQTGLVIYVSLFERLATVVGDQQVTDKLGRGAFAEICDELTAKLAAGSPTDALCSAIEAAGRRLAAALPRQDDDVNELSDALVTID